MSDVLQMYDLLSYRVILPAVVSPAAQNFEHIGFIFIFPARIVHFTLITKYKRSTVAAVKNI